MKHKTNKQTKSKERAIKEQRSNDRKAKAFKRNVSF